MAPGFAHSHSAGPTCRARKPGRSLLCSLILTSALALVSCSKPEPPRVTPRTARVTAVSPAGIDLTLELEVYNPNAFPVTVSSVNGTLALGSGIELGRGQAAPGASIAAKGSSLVTSQLNVGWANIGALAPFAVSAQPVPYTFRGTASLGGGRLKLDIPFTLTGELTREQLLQLGLQGLGSVGLPPAPR
jgi:late embryogenesis abundant protein